MLRKLIAAALLAAIASGASALTLTASAYPSTGVVPDSIALTMNGTAVSGCAVASSSGGVVPTCSLPVLTPGTYTFVMTAHVSGTCGLPNANAQTCSQPGNSPPSAAFVLTVLAPAGAPTGLSIAP